MWRKRTYRLPPNRQAPNRYVSLTRTQNYQLIMIDFDEGFEIDRSNEDEFAKLDQLLFIIKELKKTHAQELESEVAKRNARKGIPQINVRLLLPILESDNYIEKKGDYYHLTGTGLRFEGYLKENFQKAIDKREAHKSKPHLSETIANQMKEKIFISHSSKDLDYIKSFVENILILGLEIPASRIFCSSIEGQGVKSGQYIPDRLKKEINLSCLALLFISENYKQSEVCLNEVGAAWAVLEKENVIPVLLPQTGFDELGFLDLGRLGLKANSRQGILKLIQDSRQLLNPDFNLERLNSKIENYLSEVKALEEKYSPVNDTDEEEEVSEWTRCFTNNLYALDEIIRKAIPAHEDGIHQINDVKTRNQILTDLSKAKFLKHFWYKFAHGDYYVEKLDKLPSGNWLMSVFNWELKISDMWIAMYPDLQYEFILIRSEGLELFTINSDVGGQDYSVGILSDGTIVSNNERINGYAKINGESIDLHEHGIQPRMRKKESNWILLVSNYHKFGNNPDEAIELCGKLDKGEIEVNSDVLFEIQTHLRNHPTVISYM